VLLADINVGPNGSSPQFFTAANGILFFNAWDPTNGCELWKIDGTAAGTVLVKDIRPGSMGSYPGPLVHVNGTLYFRANDGATGLELWTSDGTTAGTVLVTDIVAGSSGSNPYRFTDVNGTLFFTAAVSSYGREPWVLRPSVPGEAWHLGVARPNGTGGLVFALDSNGNLAFDPGVDAVFNFGLAADTIVVGDWTGNRISKLGVARPNATGGLVFSLDSNGNLNFDPGVDAVFNFGLASDTIVVGDWDGNGVAELGVARPNGSGGLVFALDSNGNRTFDPGVDAVFNFGLANDRIVTGVWPPVDALMAAGAPTDRSSVSILPSADLANVVEQAVALLVAAGLDAEQAQLLDSVQVQIVDLPDAYLGLAVANVVYLDADAAGWGWFVDSTPELADEYSLLSNDELRALTDSAAEVQMDLLSAVLHELGHVLGLDHDDDSESFMSARLRAGVRQLPHPHTLDALLIDEAFATQFDGL
jgi:ELWxxDGT repeat protein